MKKWLLLLSLFFTPHVIAAKAGLILDVRTPNEYQQEHVAGAINVEYQVIGQEITRLAPDKKAPIVLYCKSGRRAGIALEQLTKMGYSQVENAGGLEDMKKRLLKR